MLTLGASAHVRLTAVAVAPVGTVPRGTYFRPDVEIGGATWGGDAPAYAWSPDSRSIAVHYVDRCGVPTRSIPHYLGPSPTMNVVRRSAPGSTNEVREVGLVDVATHARRFIELPDSSATRIGNYAWSPTGALLIDRESDDAIDRGVDIVGNTSAAPERAWRDHRETRIYDDVASAWNVEGKSILLIGDLADRYRIYRVDQGDTVAHALTTDAVDVSGAGIANALTRSVTYVSAEPPPTERHVWRMQSDGSRRRRLTTIAGTHAPFVSPDGKSIALLSSNDATPLELYLLDVPPGATERRITRSQAPGFAATPGVRPQYVTIPSRTVTPPLHLRILFPANLDSTKSYPVLFGRCTPTPSATALKGCTPRYRNTWRWRRITSSYRWMCVAAPATIATSARSS